VFDKLIKIFSSQPGEIQKLLKTDIHSHLIPGIDDGVESYEESLEIIERFYELGFRKIITTPHIMQDFYNNEPEVILAGLDELRKRVAETGLEMELGAAAEYYLDETLLNKLENSDDLLLFGKNYLLFETSFINKPLYLDDFLFLAQSKGLTPVMAHPERYAFVHNDPELVESLINRGLLLQLNLNSLAGYYSKEVQKMARRLIDRKQIHFLGSDCHSMKHFDAMAEAMRTHHFQRACALPLLNYSL